MSAVFALGTIEIFIPHVASLKGKRQILKGLLDKIKSRTTASVAETAYHDLWQRSQISLAFVGSEKRVLEKQRILLENILAEFYQIEVTEFSFEFI